MPASLTGSKKTKTAQQPLPPASSPKDQESANRLQQLEANNTQLRKSLEENSEHIKDIETQLAYAQDAGETKQIVIDGLRANLETILGNGGTDHLASLQKQLAEATQKTQELETKIQELEAARDQLEKDTLSRVEELEKNLETANNDLTALCKDF